MYYSYVEIEYVATSFSPTRTDLAVKLLTRVTRAADATKATVEDVYMGEAMVVNPRRMLGVLPKEVDFPKKVVSPPQWALAVTHLECSCPIPRAVFAVDTWVVLLHTMHPLLC
jgi:hypothetical protein